MSSAARLPVMARPFRRRPGDSGQATVEFAFVVPMLVIMILGLVEFARLWMQFQVATDAAREGARMAVIADGAPPADKNAAVFSAVRDALGVAGVNTEGAQLISASCGALPTGSASIVEVHECGWDASRGVPARVALRVPYKLLFLGPFLGWSTGQQTITLSTAITMRNE